MIVLIFILLGIPTLLLMIDFIRFLISKRRLFDKVQFRFLEFIGIILFPFLYFKLLDGIENDCCNLSATFSPDHKLTIYFLISICIISYFYSSLKKRISSPVIEVLTNTFLLFGFIFNIFIAIQIGRFYWLFGNISVGILFTFQLINNHKAFLEFNQSTLSKPTNYLEKISLSILMKNPIVKIPILFILCLPLLTVISSLLMLFGQKPDSIILAFTDTYKHGFSKLDYLCENVSCGGHFLCSVAANGHRKIVYPIRYGERNGNMIICNRQLLISNAFEELIQQKLPMTHKYIRHNYNKVGNTIHKHYHIFNNKFVSDCIYILMKPLEFFFLLTLYCFDQKPENRIAKQYTRKF